MAHTIRIIGGDVPRQRVNVQRVMRLKRRQMIDATSNIRSVTVTKRGRWGKPHRCCIELVDGRRIDAEATDAAIGQLISWSSTAGESSGRSADTISQKRKPTLAEGFVAVLLLAGIGWGLYSARGWIGERFDHAAEASRERRDAAAESTRIRSAPASAQKPHLANDVATSELIFDANRAARGEQAFADALAPFPQLDEFYATVDDRNVASGFPAGLSLPAEVWVSLSEEVQTDIGHFLSRESPINGWRITVGSIDGTDILADRTAMTSAEWALRMEPDARYEDVAEQRDRRERDEALRRALAGGEPGTVSGMAKVMLYGEAREHVRESLRSPSGARFAPPESDPSVLVIREEDGDVVVRGWVDAMNGFGAKVRTHWSATIRPSASGAWTLVELTTTP